ncbi:YwdI family protein [Alkalicoccobacillus porphyridii]|uniref:YwdI family protein n=1 Tax=Alkalicoccobacillus porphyridii TaxID=2597270 RepID=A0A553ZUJ4_9BACI|nr:YwdI family protein [Alkalicoccobacillus porphyridii]TSB44995.1 hypothetical protein FN960_18650 [Alkalicoccobacillus porphyridii]
MNISAERVVTNMEEQLRLLKQAINNQDHQAVREYTSVIEGYCRLLKDTPNHSQTIQPPEHTPKPAVSTPAPTPTTQNTSEKPGSLFDF